tara:strand:- start:870 stop:1514 length:645 start_codon:yes stop_codon:yes gene_type:complete
LLLPERNHIGIKAKASPKPFKPLEEIIDKVTLAGMANVFSGVKYRHGFMVDQNKLIDKVPLNDETDTHKIASILAAEVEPGDVLCLYGDLGVGKTSFARAFIRTLTSGDEIVPSPTYTIIQNYYVKRNNVNLEILHADLYRISCETEISELGLDEAFLKGISLIEWPEIARSLLPQNRLEVHIRFGKGIGERCMELFGPDRWLSIRRSIASLSK